MAGKPGRSGGSRHRAGRKGAAERAAGVLDSMRRPDLLAMQAGVAPSEQPDLFAPGALALHAALDGKPLPADLQQQAAAEFRMAVLVADHMRAMAGDSEAMARCLRRMFRAWRTRGHE